MLTGELTVQIVELFLLYDFISTIELDSAFCLK